MSRTLIYALGGGMGHAVRGSAIAAALADGVVLLPEDKGPIAEALGARWRPMREAPPAALRAAVVDALRDEGAEHLVVDTFPRGLRCELEPLPPVPRRTLLARLCRGVGADALGGRFTEVLDLEPHLGWLQAVGGEPFGPVIRPLGAGPPTVDVLLLPTDPPFQGLCSRLAAALRREGRTVQVGAAFPEVLTSVRPRVLVGEAGFNLVYEAARAGVHHLAVPRPRAADDQRRRALAVAELPGSPEALVRRALALSSPDSEPRRALRVREADELAARLDAP